MPPVPTRPTSANTPAAPPTPCMPPMTRSQARRAAAAEAAQRLADAAAAHEQVLVEAAAAVRRRAALSPESNWDDEYGCPDEEDAPRRMVIHAARASMAVMEVVAGVMTPIPESESESEVESPSPLSELSSLSDPWADAEDWWRRSSSPSPEPEADSQPEEQTEVERDDGTPRLRLQHWLPLLLAITVALAGMTVFTTILSYRPRCPRQAGGAAAPTTARQTPGCEGVIYTFLPLERELVSFALAEQDLTETLLLPRLKRFFSPPSFNSSSPPTAASNWEKSNGKSNTNPITILRDLYTLGKLLDGSLSLLPPLHPSTSTSSPSPSPLSPSSHPPSTSSPSPSSSGSPPPPPPDLITTLRSLSTAAKSYTLLSTALARHSSSHLLEWLSDFQNALDLLPPSAPSPPPPPPPSPGSGSHPRDAQPLLSEVEQKTGTDANDFAIISGPLLLALREEVVPPFFVHGEGRGEWLLSLEEMLSVGLEGMGVLVGEVGCDGLPPAPPGGGWGLGGWFGLTTRGGKEGGGALGRRRVLCGLVERFVAPRLAAVEGMVESVRLARGMDWRLRRRVEGLRGLVAELLLGPALENEGGEKLGDDGLGLWRRAVERFGGKARVEEWMGPGQGNEAWFGEWEVIGAETGGDGRPGEGMGEVKNLEGGIVRFNESWGDDGVRKDELAGEKDGEKDEEKDGEKEKEDERIGKRERREADWAERPWYRRKRTAGCARQRFHLLPREEMSEAVEEGMQDVWYRAFGEAGIEARWNASLHGAGERGPREWKMVWFGGGDAGT